MGRKKRLFTGTNPIGGKAIKSRKKARQITSDYHRVRHELETLHSSGLPKKEKEHIKKSLETEIEQLGGIDAYQQASVISTHYFKTSKWIAKALLSNLCRASLVAEDGTSVQLGNKSHKIRTLEIGAINTQLLDHPRFSVRAIDINSQNPRIEECNFFSIVPKFDYEAVVCSMVVNFVTEPEQRMDMIARLLCHLLPHRGQLCLVLPLRCINSPLLGRDKFEDLLNAFGAQNVIPPRMTPKLIFYLLQTEWKLRADSKSKQQCASWEAVIADRLRENLSASTREFFTRDIQGICDDPLKYFSLKFPPSWLS